MLIGLPGEAVESLSGQVLLGRRKVVWPRYSLDVEQVFSIVFALCDDLVRLLAPGKLRQVCVCCYLSASSDCPCDLGVPPKLF